jgi:TRAP-type C4-dicarboxylate transport system permease small subunit
LKGGLKMDLLNKWMDKINHFCAYISAAILFLMMIWIFLDVLLRSIFNAPIVGTLEITGEYILPLIIFFAIGYTQKHKDHVNVDILVGRFPKGVQKVLGLFCNLVALIMFILLGLFNFQQGLDAYANDIRSSSLLKYPLAPAIILVSLGILLFSLRLLVDTINLFRSNTKAEIGEVRKEVMTVTPETESTANRNEVIQ